MSIPDHIVRRVIERRGRLHIYDCLELSSTALVVVDMQNVYVLAGMPLEVPCLSEVIPNVNRLAAAVRRGGGVVVWLRMTLGTKEDWPDCLRRCGPVLGDAVAANLAPGSHGGPTERRGIGRPPVHTNR